MSQKDDKILLWSNTAKWGFQNERDIIDKFNNWERDLLSQEWLQKMGYNLSQIEYVKATPENAKAKNFFTIEQDGLLSPWYGKVFVNPPYSENNKAKRDGKNIYGWIEKCSMEIVRGGVLIRESYEGGRK